MKKPEKAALPLDEAPADAPAPETEPPAEAAPPAPTVEQLRDAKKTPDWQFAAAKRLRRWPIGKVVTEAAYDEAVLEASHVPMSSPSIRIRRKAR